LSEKKPADVKLNKKKKMSISNLVVKHIKMVQHAYDMYFAVAICIEGNEVEPAPLCVIRLTKLM
jgi:hypothetical protein